MYNQIPGQKQQVYTQNYVPGVQNTNVVLPNQVQYQMQYNIPQGTPVQMQIPEDKGKLILQVNIKESKLDINQIRNKVKVIRSLYIVIILIKIQN